MRLLLYSWKANNEQVLADNLIRAGHKVVWFTKECRHYTRDMELAMEMIPRIHADKIEAVISFNYFPIISMICGTCGIDYYAWVYDCPHYTLYARQVTMPCNHIGIFDREMTERLRAYGVQTVYHVPLSVDTEYFAAKIEEGTARRAVEGGKDYCCDISFVGSLYTDAHNYFDMIFAGQGAPSEQVASGRLRRRLDDAVERQRFLYDRDCLSEALKSTDEESELLAQALERKGLLLGEDYFAEPQDIALASVLEKKVTVEERRELLEAVANAASGKGTSGTKPGGCGQNGTNWNFKLYTNSKVPQTSVLRRHDAGTVDYHTQMPLVFAGSRINLNISLRSIHSGIPLRVLDIMACGGFVLTNWQPEIEENFVEGKEIATFRSKEECMEKIAYYLEHEEERVRVARAGWERVREQFSYAEGLGRLFCGENEILSGSH